MKVLVGVDDGRVFRPVLDLLARLNLEGGLVTLAHAVDVMAPIPMYGIAESAFGIDFAENMGRIGEETLQDAEDFACGRGIRAETVLLNGAAGAALIELADREHFDLIAVHSVRKTGLGSLFLGSVAKSLAIGSHRSILISKTEPGQVRSEGPLSVVFATDHSDYAERSLASFLEMRARGVDAVHVVSAAWMNDYDAYVVQYELAKMAGTTGAWVEEQLEQKNAVWVARLQEAGFKATSEIRRSSPDLAIRDSMEAQKADLLVMGAQGHGFVHRLMIGSVSLHQVVAEPYPVLVLRP